MRKITMTGENAVYVEHRNDNTTPEDDREVVVGGDVVVVEDSRERKMLTPERYMTSIDIVLRRLKEAEQQLQDAKGFMEKRLETGYEHYEQKSVESMCNALAIVNEQHVGLMNILNYKIEY